MAQVGSLTVDLIAQTASFNANIEKAAANLNSNAARMDRAVQGISDRFDRMANAAQSAGLVLAGIGLGKLAKEGLDYAAGLGEAAQQIGVTTRELQVFRAIGQQVGVTQEDMDKGLSKLTLTMGKAADGSKEQAAALERLGISTLDSSGKIKSTGVVFGEIAEALSKVPDPAQRAAIEVALFGRAGQKLDGILTQGKAGVEDYARRMEEMGMVIGDDLVNGADAAADRMAELNNQMKVKWAKTVAENAESILTLTNALASLLNSGLQLVANYPRITAAMTGIAVGGRMGGAPGAAVGGTLGFLSTINANVDKDDANMNVEFRMNRLRLITQQADKARAAGMKASSYYDEEKRQRALFKQATSGLLGGTKTAALPPADMVSLPPLPKTGSGKGKKTREEKSKADPEGFQNDLSNLEEDILRAKRSNAMDALSIASLESQILAKEQMRFEESVKADIREGKFGQIEGDKLIALKRQVTALEQVAIDNELAERLSRDQLQVAMAANDNQRDMLQAQLGLATTAKDRGALSLRLLELDKQSEKLKLEEIVASRTASEAEKEIARARLAMLDNIYGAKEEGARRQNAGPMEAYLRDVNMTKDQVNEAIDGIKVRGLDSLNQGLVDAITGVKSLGDVFRDVARQIIADLLQIAIRKAVITPLANMLFGGFGGGGGGGASLASGASSITGQIAGLGRGFASGGLVMGPGSGTSDSIIAALSNGEFVINAAAVRRIGIDRLNALNSGHPRFASGGPVGPASVRNLGFNDNGAQMKIEVVPNPYFDVRVDGRIVTAAPAIMQGGAKVALVQGAQRQSRRLG